MTNHVQYTATGVTSVFPFPFAINADTDCQVLIDGVVQSGDYSVRGQGSLDGGAVVFDSAPIAGKIIAIRRVGEIAVTAMDASGGYLADKLVAGAGISVDTVTEAGGAQHLVISGPDLSTALSKSANLADLLDVAAARDNLDVYSMAETDFRDQAVANAAQVKLGDLSGVTDVGAARTKLDVYSKSETDAAITTKMGSTGLLKANNLNDVSSVPAARTNLDVYSTTETDAAITAKMSSTGLLKANNLNDVSSVPAARTNLGVYSTTETDAAITAKMSNTGLLKANNLSDVANVATARANLGVYSTGEADTAMTAKVTSTALLKANNLTDVPDKAAARTALGLDQAAYLNAAQDWTKPQRSQAVLAAPVGGSTALDLAQYQNFNLTLTANITFANPAISAAMVGQKGTIGITPAGFSIAGMGNQWKRVGTTGSPDVITGIGRIDYHIRALDRIEYAYNDVEA